MSTLLDDLSIQMWESPLHDRIRARRRIDAPALTVLALLALRTELEMGGVMAFLENEPAGFTLSDAIAACDAIEARSTAHALREIERLVKSHGVSGETLRVSEMTRMSMRSRMRSMPKLSCSTTCSSYGKHRSARSSPASECSRER